MAEITFWGSIVMLVWVFGGFGTVVGLWGSLRQRHVRKRTITPKVTLIIAAYNEERGLRDKIENSLAIDYPKGSLEIIMGSDGSTDGTVSIIDDYASEGIVLLDLPRRGKIHVLNHAVSIATGEILVFSDANTLYHPQALRMLVRNFADPQVGGVCGNQRHLRESPGDSSGDGESLYWRYDKWLKAMESETGSIVSADGAMYAIRRELYREPESAAVTDDFAISTAVVERGYRLVFEREAIGYEPTAGAARDEFGRKVRVMNRGMNGVVIRRKLLNPFRYGFYSLVLFSHKVLRRLAAVALLALFGSSLLLASTSPVYALAAWSQAAFYTLAALGFLLREKGAGRSRILSTPFFFCLANAAALVALFHLARGHRIERWKPRRTAGA